MKLSLVFEQSGDSIEFDVLQSDLVEFYVAHLLATNTRKFSYYPRLNSKSITLSRTTLRDNFEVANKFLNDKLGITVFNQVDVDNLYFDQQQLNYIHCQWVKLNRDPELLIIHKMSTEYPEYMQAYQKLNTGVHKNENNWKFRFDNKMWKPPEYVRPATNPFGNDIASFDVANLRIRFNGLGRTTVNKWENFDDNINDVDTQNFEELHGSLELNLFRPKTVSPPPEYIAFCNKHNTPAVGSHLPLANISNLQDLLGKYRSMLTDNIAANNPFELIIY